MVGNLLPDGIVVAGELVEPKLLVDVGLEREERQLLSLESALQHLDQQLAVDVDPTDHARSCTPGVCMGRVGKEKKRKIEMKNMQFPREVLPVPASTVPPSLGLGSNPPMSASEAMMEDCCSVKFSPSRSSSCICRIGISATISFTKESFRQTYSLILEVHSGRLKESEAYC